MAAEPWAVSLTSLDAPAQLRAALAAELGGRPELAESTVLLSTCHRVELYGFGARPPVAAPTAAGEQAVHRLLRIAAGLESASLGEDEVLHQVRLALAGARGGGLRDGRLIRLFELAIATGRRSRSAGRPRARSLQSRAIDWLAERTPFARVLVVGAGHMGSALTAEATARGAAVTVATRRPRRGAVDLETAAAVAERSDGVAIAIGGSWAVDSERLPPVADLSSPGALPVGTRLALGHNHLGIDDLFAVREEDPVYAARAITLVERAANEYVAWLRARKEATA